MPSYEPVHCIVCGHTNANVVAEHDDVRDEVEWVWEYYGRRLIEGAPPSALIDRVAFSERPPFRLVQCVECGLVYRNPAEREHELASAYTESGPPDDVLRALYDNQLPTARRQARTVRQLLGRGGSGLEVGSYAGAFLAAAREHGLDFEGVDINGCANAFVRTMGLRVHDGSIETFGADRTFDVVAIWNTFDQLADPRGAVCAAAKRLRPGGLLAIRVPNGACYAARRRLLGRGGRIKHTVARGILAQNNLLGFPYRWGFGLESLSRLLSVFDFSVEIVRGDALARTADAWTRRWARIEEGVLKRLTSAFAKRSPDAAPWIEIYARSQQPAASSQ